MLKDIPYSTLKEDKRAYAMLILRDQYGRTFADMAKEYGVSPIRAREIYSRIKVRQIRLYIRHISIALGHENTAEVQKVFQTADEWYQDFSCACAYLKKKYPQILEEYRAGEPGTAKEFLKDLLPLRRRLSKETISRIVEMREGKKATFAAIAKEMGITPEKAKHTYDSFYHQKVLKYVKGLQKQEKNRDEVWTIWQRYFGKNVSAKKRYEMVLEERETQAVDPLTGKETG